MSGLLPALRATSLAGRQAEPILTVYARSDSFRKAKVWIGTSPPRRGGSSATRSLSAIITVGKLLAGTFGYGKFETYNPFVPVHGYEPGTGHLLPYFGDVWRLRNQTCAGA